ncbi:transporter substrate-binding domain-containing protein [Leptolyngbya sp. NIES-2104]|uniref:transporter substrate-binding domain-containing protein n=1 Tax=Leptolyngbya sp. NIES-2104 TaxID=1552121 RepID=UPI0006EC5A72|nr:transporter substrate-binding domain-containing protein [Leptolyngbya sp. NIES-2104]GAP95249.1 extracellular solute-binding protein, family 3 [Leptolyngbya sp. NIES-2104]
MTIPRRFVLQTGASFLVTAGFQGCIQTAQTQQSTFKVSQTLADRVQRRGYLKVATEDDYPPFEFLVNGKPTGFDHELLARFRQVVPFQIQQEIMAWQGLLPGVGEGKYDVALTAVGVTDDRAKFLDFTMPIAESTIAYIKRKDDASITGVKSLSGKVLGVQQGGVSQAAVPDLEAELKKQGGTLGTVKQYRGFSEAYQDLISKKLDAVLHNIVSLSVLVSEKPAIFELGERVSRKSYAAWAVKKGDRELLALLNQFLQQQRDQGEMRKLQQDWFKLTFDNLPQEPLLPGDRPIAS